MAVRDSGVFGVVRKRARGGKGTMRYAGHVGDGGSRVLDILMLPTVHTPTQTYVRTL